MHSKKVSNLKNNVILFLETNYVCEKWRALHSTLFIFQFFQPALSAAVFFALAVQPQENTIQLTLKTFIPPPDLITTIEMHSIPFLSFISHGSPTGNDNEILRRLDFKKNKHKSWTIVHANPVSAENFL